MNKQEALKILGLDSAASEDEIKKQFKKLSFEKHPDRNKEKDAEDNYKKISEAFNYLKSNKGSTKESNPWTKVWEEDFNNYSAGFNYTYGYTVYGYPPPKEVYNINIPLTLTFAESVLGCTKDIKYTRKAKCSTCQGDGKKKSEGSCKICNGVGRTAQKVFIGSGIGDVVAICGRCNGSGRDFIDCEACKGDGSIDAEKSISFKITGGLVSGSIVRLANSGNYYKLNGVDSQSHVMLNINVIPEPGMRLSGTDVISTLDVDLLDLLKGTEKKVNTVLGEKVIKIVPKSKHKDEAFLPNCGVNNKGKHIFVLNMLYPDNIEDVIFALEKKDGV